MRPSRRLLALAFASSLSTLAASASAQSTSPQDLPPAPAAPAVAAAPSRRAFIILPKIGIQLGGGATLDGTCDGTAPAGGTCANKSTDIDEAGGPALGLDLLGALSDSFRLGGGLLFNTDANYKKDGSGASFGKDLSLVAIAEGVFPVSKTVSFTVRAQGGALMFFPGGKLTDLANNDRTLCAAISASCDINDGTKLGYTYGAGGGLLFDVGRVGLRADFLWQGYGAHVLSEHISIPGAAASLDNKLTGNRFWLFLGVEI